MSDRAQGSVSDVSEVVITGIGVVTPIGIGKDAFWRGLMDGTSGAGPLTLFDASALPVQIASQVNDFDATSFMDAREVPRNDRFTHMGVAAAALAIEDADLDDVNLGASAGVIVGSGIGGLSTIESEHDSFTAGGPRRVSPFMVPKLMPNAAAAAIAMRYGYHGPNFAPSSACATGAHSVGEAFRYVREGVCDVMIAGGTEAAITPLAVERVRPHGGTLQAERRPDPC